ncbi:MAG TPA: PepSY domain-containing protein [Pseudomonadales bacterium]|nr:PepSY domain-containing protein [Pseudomonadales bacterium]
MIASMRVRRAAVQVHKWIALIVGVQLLLWIAGGVVMSVVPIETVRSEDRTAVREPAALAPAGLVPLAAALGAAELTTVRTARLTVLLDAPVWQLTAPDGRVLAVDARSGLRLSPLPEATVRRIAIADRIGPVEVASLQRLEVAPAEYGGPVPVWQVHLDDGDGTVLYVDPDTGAVRARRSDIWRFYDLFWRLHVMDYDDGADFNHPLLIAASLVALLVALSGLTLLYLRMRQSLLVWRGVRRRRSA